MYEVRNERVCETMFLSVIRTDLQHPGGEDSSAPRTASQMRPCGVADTALLRLMGPDQRHCSRPRQECILAQLDPDDYSYDRANTEFQHVSWPLLVSVPQCQDGGFVLRGRTSNQFADVPNLCPIVRGKLSQSQHAKQSTTESCRQTVHRSSRHKLQESTLKNAKLRRPNRRVGG